MIQYYLTHDETKCSGCGVCEQMCRQSAIKMNKNEEGFLYPSVNEAKCIHCELCDNVCHMQRNSMEHKPLEAYAVMNKDEEKLINSSSGGAFRLLADYVVNLGGYVAGCILDDNMNAIYKITNNSCDIVKMQGSKYVSSCLGDVYKEIKDILTKGKTILFTGAPCQNAALISYLNGQPDNLITVDFLCHGMPSQKIFNKYIEYLEDRYHNKVSNFKFRDKEYRGWGHVESFYIGGKKHYNVGVTSTYLYGYLRGYFSRYSCYNCQYRGKRVTDFTMCDYWGVNKYHHFPNMENGVSAITINTIKAHNIFESIIDQALCESTKIEWIADENPSIIYRNKETIPQIRKIIFSELTNKGWKTIAHKYLMCSHRFVKRIWYMLPRNMTGTIKKIIKKG